MQTLAQFIEGTGITGSAKLVDSNPNASGFDADARHWLVSLHHDGKLLEVPFSQGSALTEDPTVADVLNCLADDASTFENVKGDFWDWCDEYGFDSSRENKRTFDAVDRQTLGLRLFLGSPIFDALLWDTGRS